MYVILQERFQQHLQAALRDLGWTQAEFARRLGVSQQNVSKYFTGRCQPGLDVVEKFANVLELDDPMDLLKPVEESQPVG